MTSFLVQKTTERLETLVLGRAIARQCAMHQTPDGVFGNRNEAWWKRCNEAIIDSSGKLLANETLAQPPSEDQPWSLFCASTSSRYGPAWRRTGARRAKVGGGRGQRRCFCYSATFELAGRLLQGLKSCTEHLDHYCLPSLLFFLVRKRARSNFRPKRFRECWRPRSAHKASLAKSHSAQGRMRSCLDLIATFGF